MPRIIDGALTERQEYIIEEVIKGKLQSQIAKTLITVSPSNGRKITGVSDYIVRSEVAAIKAKLDADTSSQAAAVYATGMAYRHAAAQVLGSRFHHPEGQAEKRVNEMLESIASTFHHWSRQHIPE